MPRKKFDRSLLPPFPDLTFEQELWRAGMAVVAGIDEAGRGALAGPVAAGAVVLPKQNDLPEALSGVRDSKQMSAKSRRQWADQIKTIAIGHCVGFAEPAEIDELGIIPATRLAASRALELLAAPPEHLLVDHIAIHAHGIPETALTKGDQRSLSIAAASILAKVARDERPPYGFAAHKGYGTARHLAAIEEHGPCPAHRMSFSPLRPDEQMPLF